MMKTNKKCAFLTFALLVIGIIATTIYYHFNSKTADEYAEQCTKELIEIFNRKDEIAFNLKNLDFESQELVNKYGRFLVKVKEVRPFLDGYKIKFSIWNFSNFTLPNPKVKLKWNYLMKEYNPQDILDMPKEYCGDWNNKYQKEIDDWGASFHEKEFTNLKDIIQKSWTDLEFIVLPCSSEQFQHVEFSIVG